MRMLWRAALFHRGSMGAFAKTTESLLALWQITQGCGGESVLFASTNSRGVAGGARRKGVPLRINPSIPRLPHR